MNHQSLAALKKTTAGFPGGLEALADWLDVSTQTLDKMLGGHAGFKMGLVQALTISDKCIEAETPDCYAFVNAIRGGARQMLQLPVIEMPIGKQDLRSDMASLLQKCSDAFTALTGALADEKISDNELRVIHREVLEMLSKGHDVIRGANANNAASKPAHLSMVA